MTLPVRSRRLGVRLVLPAVLILVVGAPLVGCKRGDHSVKRDDERSTKLCMLQAMDKEFSNRLMEVLLGLNQILVLQI